MADTGGLCGGTYPSPLPPIQVKHYDDNVLEVK